MTGLSGWAGSAEEPACAYLVDGSGVYRRLATGSAFRPSSAGEPPPVAAAFLDVGDHVELTVELGQLLAQAPMYIACTDTDLRYTWSSGRVRDLYGLTGSGVGKTVFEVGDPDQQALVAVLRRALDGHPSSYRAQVRGRWLDNWVGPLRGCDGKIVGTVVVTLDVTEQELARQREGIAEERFRRLVDHSPALVDLRNADDELVYANPTFLRAFGPNHEDVFGGGGVGAEPDDDGATDLAKTARLVLETERSRPWEGRIAHPDGDDVDLIGHVFPMPMADGSTGIAKVFLDITDQERARRQLADSERRYRAVYDGSAVGILLLDLDGRILDANQACLRLAGRELRELRGRFLGTLTTREDIEAHRPHWLDLVAGRRNRLDAPMTIRRLDGGLLPARLTVTVVRDGDGRPAQAIAIILPLAPVDSAVRVPERSRPTAGEADVLRGLAAGHALRQIGDELALTRRGVDYRITRLRHKLRADGPDGTPASTAAIVARAYALGVLLPYTWPPRVAGDPPKAS